MWGGGKINRVYKNEKNVDINGMMWYEGSMTV